MIGDRIQQARKASGMSMRELAEKAGVSAMAISKYENNKNTPSSSVLLGLSKALGVRAEYFFRQAKIELKDVEYRIHAKLPKKILNKIEGDVIEQIERYFALEEILPSNPIQKFKLPKGLKQKIENYDDVEELANTFRKEWKLGCNPIPELIDTFEERGIKVFLSGELQDAKFDGLAAKVDGMPVIVVDKYKPGDRQRFTLAHELGHLAIEGRLAEGVDVEKAANRFAGAFLVPAKEAVKELGESRSWLEPAELYALKHTYGLSMRGWIYRASDLAILNRFASRKMWEYFRENNWVETEPGDQLEGEEPRLFRQLVFHAVAEDLIGDSKAAELLSVPIVEFRKLRKMEISEQTAVNQ